MSDISQTPLPADFSFARESFRAWFTSTIKAYAKERGVSPATIIQYAAAGSGVTWKNWQRGNGPTVDNVDKVLSYLRENPAPRASQEPSPQ